MGATFHPLAAFAQGGVPMTEKIGTIPLTIENRTVRSYVSQL